MTLERLGDVLILGLGESGTAAARYCLDRLGDEVASVTVVDGASGDRVTAAAEPLIAAGARVLTGATGIEGSFDLCIASPGIPPHAPLLVGARAASRDVVSELEFAFSRSKNPWLAVTGTNGKTTTTSLVTHLLTHAGVSARSVGNIGTPAISVVAESDGDEILVAEVSSFQLALTRAFHPRVAVLLNITPDHIDWHGSLEMYAADKARVFAQLGPDDVAVIDVDDPGSAPFAEALDERGVPVVTVSVRGAVSSGARIDDGMLVLDTSNGPLELVAVDELRIKGAHNVSNALSAASAARAMGVTAADLREGLKSFEPIEHRLEPVAIVAGVEWFNDSKATNPDAVLKAVAAFSDRPYILLLGGRNKGNDFGPLAAEVAKGARAAITFGEAGPSIAAAFAGTGLEPVCVDGLQAAVVHAASIACEGDAVVLSPACASFDEFTDYQHRGREFKRMVHDQVGGERS